MDVLEYRAGDPKTVRCQNRMKMEQTESLLLLLRLLLGSFLSAHPNIAKIGIRQEGWLAPFVASFRNDCNGQTPTPKPFIMTICFELAHRL